MGLEVEVGAVGDSLQLVPPPGEQELHVGGGRRVVGELVGVVVAQPELSTRGCPRSSVPPEPLVQPVLEPTGGLIGGDEVLHLHLLELPGPEDEVLRGDLVAEGLAHLGDAEGRLLPSGLDDIGEVDEHALGRLRPEVGDRPLVLQGPGVGLEHEVEGPGRGELGRSAGRAYALDLVLARQRWWQWRQSTNGSVKLARWPEASHTAGGERMAASRPTTSSRRCTMASHHAFLTLRSMLTPSGP